MSARSLLVIATELRDAAVGDHAPFSKVGHTRSLIVFTTLSIHASHDAASSVHFAGRARASAPWCWNSTMKPYGGRTGSLFFMG